MSQMIQIHSMQGKGDGFRGEVIDVVGFSQEQPTNFTSFVDFTGRLDPDVEPVSHPNWHLREKEALAAPAAQGSLWVWYAKWGIATGSSTPGWRCSTQGFN